MHTVNDVMSVDLWLVEPVG